MLYLLTPYKFFSVQQFSSQSTLEFVKLGALGKVLANIYNT